MKLHKQTFKEVVRHTPLVSLDFVIKNKEGKILLGKRKNQPAKGYWFVPGGRILKDEKIEDAFQRLTKEELGTLFSRGFFSQLGIYDHIYDSNFSDDQSFGTHYIVLAHQLRLQKELSNLPKNQHESYRWASETELLNDPEVHPYTKAYFKSQVSISAV